MFIKCCIFLCENFYKNLMSYLLTVTLLMCLPSRSVETPKEERPELQKKTYKWNTKEEAKQAFKELLKEKVSPVKQG